MPLMPVTLTDAQARRLAKLIGHAPDRHDIEERYQFVRLLTEPMNKGDQKP